MGNFLSGDEARLSTNSRAIGIAALLKSDFCHMSGETDPFTKGGLDAF